MNLAHHPIVKVIVAIAVIFTLTPIAIVVWVAFSSSAFLEFPPPGLSLRWFGAFFEREEFIHGLEVSLVLAVVVSVTAMLLGTACAYGLSKVVSRRWRTALASFTLTPLIMPVIIIAVGQLFFLSSFGLSGTLLGLVTGQLVFVVPLTALIVLGTLGNFDPELENAAASLGANPSRVVLTVTLPLIRSGVIGAGVLSFLVSFNDAQISLFLRGPNAVTLPVEMFSYIRYQINPLVAAVSALFVFATITFAALFNWLVGFDTLVGGEE